MNRVIRYRGQHGMRRCCRETRIEKKNRSTSSHCTRIDICVYPSEMGGTEGKPHTKEKGKREKEVWLGNCRASRTLPIVCSTYIYIYIRT